MDDPVDHLDGVLEELLAEPIAPARHPVFDLLYPYQAPHVESLAAILARRHTALDGSEMGTGKMYVGSALAALTRRRLLVCCPKVVAHTWFEVAARFDVTLLGVANYEAMRIGKHYTDIDALMANRRTRNPYYNGAGAWDLPDDALLVFDEAHKCQRNTATADMMTAAARAVRMNPDPLAPAARILLASGTLADSAAAVKNAAFILGLVPFGKSAFNAWTRRITRDGTSAIVAYHRAIYPFVGARMRIDDIRMIDEHIFAHNDVQSLITRMSPEAERGIMDAYGDIAAAIDALKRKQRGELHPLTVILRARQRIEMLKVPSICMQVMEWMLSEYNVIVFVNFNETVNHVFELVDKFVQSEYPGGFVCVIRGGQTLADRRWNIDAFQSGRSRVIICNIAAGGVGVSLHGQRRASIISPPWSAIDFEQAKRRAYRAGGGDVIQRVMYCSGNVSLAGPDTGPNDTTFLDGARRMGVEEKMARALNKKMAAICALNGEVAPHRV